jgi:hypothetical protein
MDARHALLALALALPAGVTLAQTAAKPADAEPRVQHIVVEDGGSRIEELLVRGATQRITVQPKVGTSKGYEIITGDGSRDLGEGVNTSRGAAGKRVWNVLKF